MSHKEAIHYIRKSRKKGYSDEQIRVKMLVSGYMPKQLNDYFKQADDVQSGIKQFTILSIVVLVLIGSVLLIGRNADLTAAALWSWPWTATYDCGDDYPAEERYVKDLSDCIADDEPNILFCYVNNTVSTDEISPDSLNDNWYLREVREDISSVGEIDTVSLLESSIVFPWIAEYDNVDCVSWTHGTVRTSDWHLCNSSQENLVFYFNAVAGDINDTYGGLSTELGMNSSYYLCYDELECTTQTTECDDDYYCVGRLDDEYGSAWYPCDTTLEADYYRCCKAGCEAMEMMCGEYLLQSDGSEVAFNECRSDGSSGCCDSDTDCIYGSTCYNEDDTIEYEYIYTSMGGGEMSLANYTFTCTDAHWCPWGFEYNERYSRCEPLQAACYDATDPDYCNYIYGVDDTDLWEADTGSPTGIDCVRSDPEGVVSKEACVYTGTFGGVDYFFYQDILVDV
jgi:hypothetical protein